VGGKRWTDRDECRRRMRANGKGLGRQKPEDNRWILTDLAGNTTTNMLLLRGFVPASVFSISEKNYCFKGSVRMMFT
jgi:hypothetical protein